jgi:predicted MFS family arabinose efflux permease
MLASVGATTSFYLLLTVVPTVASARAGGEATPAGLATGALMLATVVAELATPRLVVRVGRRTLFAAGLVLLGAPALLLGPATGLPAVLGVCLLRGLGFGVVVVLGSSWMAALVPVERRGEALGLYGVGVGISAMVALPLGVWLADNVGYQPVFVIGAAAALLGLVPLAFLFGPSTEDSQIPRLGVLRGLRTPDLARPAAVFAVSAAAAGVVVTFLPAAASGSAASVVAPALLSHSACSTIGRWFAGRFGERLGPIRVLRASSVVAGLGMLALAATSAPVATVAGPALFGLGFGAAQNASITLMFENAGPGGYDSASAVWNIAYDAGMGVGAAAFGVLVAWSGFGPGFAVVATLIPLSLVIVSRRDRKGH